MNQVITPRQVCTPAFVEPPGARATAEDRTVAFMPYFAIRDAENFFEVCNHCIEKVRSEPLCLGYGFSVSAGPHQNMAFCREAFLNAEGVLNHMNNIEVLFKEGLCKYGELVSLQIHGPKEELDKLRDDPMIQEISPEFYELMPGSFEVIEFPMQQIPDVQQQHKQHQQQQQQQLQQQQVQQQPQQQQQQPPPAESPVSTPPPGRSTPGRSTPVVPLRQQARVLGGGLSEATVARQASEEPAVNIMTTPAYMPQPGQYAR